MSLPRPTRRRMFSVATLMTMRAKRLLWDGRQGYCDGQPIPAGAFWSFSLLDVEEVNTRIMFTRDTGHHTSGWLKNPDYERCWHLSLSKAGPLPEYDAEKSVIATAGGLVGPDLKPLSGLPVQTPELDRELEAAWLEAFFGEDKRYVWRESAKSEAGRKKAVWHYRIFADERWAPIVPRGEVYSTQFTELGWQSWSELHPDVPLEQVSTVDPT